jgi:hypothetical protein
MPKKIAILFLSTVLFLLARSGARACWRRWCWTNTTRNRAEITQDILGESNTGDNSQENSAEGERVRRSEVSAGDESQMIDTGKASVQIGSNIKANVNEKSHSRRRMSPRSKTYNWAEVDQMFTGLANTGENEQSNEASLTRARRSGAYAGSDSDIETGNADVSIGTITRLNYNYR